MHRLSASFVLAYHGCDRDVAERVLDGERFTPSTNDYDWLGHGIYFWEANPRRGIEYARELAARKRGASRVTRPAVVGAVIDMGLCLDLTTASGLEQVRLAHQALVAVADRTSSGSMPKNKVYRKITGIASDGTLIARSSTCFTRSTARTDRPL